MEICLSDYVFDPVLMETRSKNTSEMAGAIVLLSLFLCSVSAIFLWVFNKPLMLSLIGLFPLLSLCLPSKKKVLLAHRGNAVLFCEGAQEREFNPLVPITCQVICQHGDGYHTKVYCKQNGMKSTLTESNDYITEEKFIELFQPFFSDLNYSYKRID